MRRTTGVVALILAFALGAPARPATFAPNEGPKRMAAGGHAFIIVGEQSAELKRETQIVAENAVQNNSYAVEGIAYAKTNLIDHKIAWGLLGTQAAIVVHATKPELAIAFHGMPGVDVRAYVPRLVKLSPFRSMGRIVGTTEMRFNSASQDFLFHDEVIATTTDLRVTGEARMAIDGALDAGEYAIVLRPIDAHALTKDFMQSYDTSTAGSANGVTQPWQYAWCFSVRPR